MSPNLCRSIEFSDSSRFTFCCSNMSRRCTSKSLPDVSKNRRYAKSNACPIVSVISSAYNHHIENHTVINERNSDLSLTSVLHNSSVGKVTSYRLHNHSLIPGLIHSHSTHTDYADHQALGSLYPAINVAREQSWSLNSIPYREEYMELYTCAQCTYCVVLKHTDKITFTFCTLKA
jgi:hypothetical protein